MVFERCGGDLECLVIERISPFTAVYVKGKSRDFVIVTVVLKLFFIFLLPKQSSKMMMERSENSCTNFYSVVLFSSPAGSRREIPNFRVLMILRGNVLETKLKSELTNNFPELEVLSNQTPIRLWSQVIFFSPSLSL